VLEWTRCPVAYKKHSLEFGCCDIQMFRTNAGVLKSGGTGSDIPK